MLKIETVFFDLDGTLLPMDIDEFLQNYFELLGYEFKDLAPPDKFIKNLLAATRKMLKNNGKKTNEEVFKNKFFSLMSVEKEEEKAKLMQRFDEFYQDKFPLLKKEIESEPEALKLVKWFKDRDFRLVIATNPLFPEKAIRERIKWVGLNPEDFAFITSYEKMHYCKPNPGYFTEILQKIDADPENCIMIGNDPVEDVAAKKVGIKTYLVEDYMIERSEAEGVELIEPDWRGTLKELRQKLKQKIIKK